MKLFNHLGCGMVLLTIVATFTTVSAQDGHYDGDGHNHGASNATYSSPYDQNRPSNVRERYQPTSRYEPASGIAAPAYRRENAAAPGCSVGGCCSGGRGASTINSGTPSTPQGQFTRAAVSMPDELDRLSLRMLSIVRDELRGSRDYNNLVADAENAVRAAQRLRQSDARRAPADVMLEDARVMLTPLKRMNTALKSDDRAQESRRAVQDVGSLLVAYGRDLQSAVSRTSPAGQNLLPPRPTLPAQNRSQGVSIPEEMKGVSLLPAREQEAALRQRTCPVTRGPLGSMGKPILVDVAGRSVYVCCAGCIDALRRSPEKYLTAGNSPGRPMNQEQYPGAPPSSLSGSSAVNIPAEMKGVALLPASEQAAAMRQRTCPVTSGPLGSMGKPIRVDVAGRSIYVCCAGCVNAVKQNPQKYLR